MILYLDKENLQSFIEAKKNVEENMYYECTKLIKKRLKIIFTFPKEEIEENEKISAWHTSVMTEGRGWQEDEDKYYNNFSESLQNLNGLNKFVDSQLSSIYLLNDQNLQHFPEKKGLLVGSIGNEVDTLKKLFCGPDHDLHQLYNLRKNFPSWNKLTEDNHVLPCTDLLIVDSFLFSIQESLYEYNAYRLLEVLVGEMNQVKINIVIVTLQKSNYKDDSGKYIPISPNFKKIREELRLKIKNKTNIEPNITFIGVPQSDGNKYQAIIINKEHDRIVLTNYRQLRSGDSFNYFDSKNERLTKGRFLDVDSLAKLDNYEFSLSLKKDMQNLYENIKKLNPDLITGDKKSNFIDFK